MIDPLTEQVISLREAASQLPVRRRGRKPHVSCLYRWTVSGCRGVVLESLQVGGTRCTSREALSRFFARLTLGELVPQVPTLTQRRRQHEGAERKLDKAGVRPR